MAAEHHPFRAAIPAGQRHIEVAGGIGFDVQPQTLGGGAHQVMRGLLTRAVGVAGDADTVECLLTQAGEQPYGEVDVGGKIRAHGWLRRQGGWQR